MVVPDSVVDAAALVDVWRSFSVETLVSVDDRSVVVPSSAVIES